MPRSLLTPLVAFCVALAWSGSWITGKLAVASAPPLEISAVRFIIAAVVLAAIAIATRTDFGRGSLWPVMLAGVFGYFAYNAFVFVGLTMAPASDGALIVPTIIPVLTAVAASFVGERLTATKLVGFALASIGAALVILFYGVVRRVGAGVAAMTSYFVPVLTLAMAILFLGDRPQLLQLVGGVVILAGVRLATLRLARDAQPIPEGSA